VERDVTLKAVAAELRTVDYAGSTVGMIRAVEIISTSLNSSYFIRWIYSMYSRRLYKACKIKRNLLVTWWRNKMQK
jgi:hypothetical protein